MPLLALKLTLVPFLVFVVSMSSKWWGPGVAGWLAGLPMMGGPILFLVVAERGAEYGAVAAVYMVAGVVTADVFNTLYARACRHHGWPYSATVACAGWFVSGAAVAFLPMSRPLAVVIAVASIALSMRLLPRTTVKPAPTLLTHRDLALRMLAGLVLTLVVTLLAAITGPAWSGVVTGFPLLGLVLAVASHRSFGPEHAIAMARGIVVGRASYASFFLCISWALPALGVWPAFGVSAAVALAVHGTSRRWVGR